MEFGFCSQHKCLVQRMQREARNTQLCHQACAALSKSVGRGPRAKFLGALVDKVFLGSTRKFSQTSWGNHSWGTRLFSKNVGRGPMAKFLEALVDKVFLSSTKNLAKLHGETIPGECDCFQKMWEGGPWLNSLRLWWIRCF